MANNNKTYLEDLFKKDGEMENLTSGEEQITEESNHKTKLPTNKRKNNSIKNLKTDGISEDIPEKYLNYEEQSNISINKELHSLLKKNLPHYNVDMTIKAFISEALYVHMIRKGLIREKKQIN